MSEKYEKTKVGKYILSKVGKVKCDKLESKDGELLLVMDYEQNKIALEVRELTGKEIVIKD